MGNPRRDLKLEVVKIYKRTLFSRRKQSKEQDNDNNDDKLVTHLTENINNLKQLLDEPSDLSIRTFKVRGSEHKCAIVYIQGLADSAYVRDHIIENLQL